ADDVLLADQLGQVAGRDALAGQIVQPDRDPCGGQAGQASGGGHGGVALHPLRCLTFSTDRLAAFTTASAVIPNSVNSVCQSADAPKCSMPTTSPVSPTNRCHEIGRAHV